MRGNNVLGIVFSNTHDETLRELTEVRTMGSVPFGGRYRLIDFALSNLVNSGVDKVGVLTNHNYQSLLDHLGSGKAWDLSKKRDGLYLLPPFNRDSGVYNGKIEALNGIMSFLRRSKEEYVVMTDCDILCNIDIMDVVRFHIEKGADITAVYKKGVLPDSMADKMIFDINRNRRINDLSAEPAANEKCAWGMNMFVMGRQYLIDTIKDLISRNRINFTRDFMLKAIEEGKVYGYKFEGYTGVFNSVAQYFEASLALTDPKVRKDLFNPERPVYTKVRDEAPAKYGLGSNVHNCLVADGCEIEGEVENCILFRGVKIGANTKLRNCIIMQDCVIGENCELANVIIDKDATLKDGRTLLGFEAYPVYIRKGSVV